MIAKTTIENIIYNYIQDTDIFIVEINVKPGDVIQVTLDKPEGITISECSEINKYVVSLLNDHSENFELEISSPGLGAPFRVLQQYKKNIGKEVEIFLFEGKKIKGTLISVSKETIEIEEIKKVNKETVKKPEYGKIINTYSMKEIKSAKLIVNFK